MSEAADVERVRAHMLTCLQAAVPLWLAELNSTPEFARVGVAESWAEHAGEQIAAQGDILMYGGGKKGETAAVFNALARGLAAMSTKPGGVLFLDLVWCATHSPGGAPAEQQVCKSCLEAEAA